MNRIKYKDVEVLKREYQEIFNLQRFQKLQHMWSDVREELIGLGCDALVYPMLWPDILVADFKELAKIYFDYTRIAREIPASLKQSIANIFKYSESRRSKIAEFFRNHAGQIELSGCCYCDMSYVNTYCSRNGKRRSHFDLDHFLPKSKCPITALSLFNFIPCCPICNQRLKRNSTWFNDIDEAIMSSPSSPQYGFDGNVKYRLIPTDSFKVIRYQDCPDLFQVAFHTDSPTYKKMINSLYLGERYEFHKCEALWLLDKMQDYPSSHIRMIHNALCKNGTPYSEAKIREDIFGVDFIQKYNRTFSKMTRDIMDLYEE